MTDKPQTNLSPPPSEADEESASSVVEEPNTKVALLRAFQENTMADVTFSTLGWILVNQVIEFNPELNNGELLYSDTVFSSKHNTCTDKYNPGVKLAHKGPANLWMRNNDQVVKAVSDTWTEIIEELGLDDRKIVAGTFYLDVKPQTDGSFITMIYWIDEPQED